MGLSAASRSCQKRFRPFFQLMSTEPSEAASATGHLPLGATLISLAEAKLSEEFKRAKEIWPLVSQAITWPVLALERNVPVMGQPVTSHGIVLIFWRVKVC